MRRTHTHKHIRLRITITIEKFSSVRVYTARYPDPDRDIGSGVLNKLLRVMVVRRDGRCLIWNYLCFAGTASPQIESLTSFYP